MEDLNVFNETVATFSASDREHFSPSIQLIEEIFKSNLSD